MPEGDTLFRAARQLRRVLPGKQIVSAQCPESSMAAADLEGRVVLDVESRGKHLLIHLDDGSAIHSHLGMHGSWRTYDAREAPRSLRRSAGIALATDSHVSICFSPKLLEHLTATGLKRHPYLQRLGPDLLAKALDEAEVLRRFRTQGRSAIGEAIMNQTVACGVGNVYKSEVLFLTETNPFVRVDVLDDSALAAIVQRARKLMMRNLTTFRRQTRFATDGGRLWVYGRQGQPCFRCGETIGIRRQGDLGRTTYWCPSCQA